MLVNFFLFWESFIVPAEKAQHLASEQKRHHVNFVLRQLSPYLDLENTQRLGLPYTAEEGTPTSPTSTSVQILSYAHTGIAGFLLNMSNIVLQLSHRKRPSKNCSELFWGLMLHMMPDTVCVCVCV